MKKYKIDTQLALLLVATVTSFSLGLMAVYVGSFAYEAAYSVSHKVVYSLWVVILCVYMILQASLGLPIAAFALEYLNTHCEDN